ncbi:MAG TPA: Ig-like domain-containing protein, partial [Longimicrobium sp.]|nr:Ig-like domain-containing protein [Longimicrobium sp.]
MRASRSFPPLLPLALLLAVACGDGTSPASPSPSPAVPAALFVVEGDAQQGAAGAELAQPLAVRVVDATSRPVPGAAVRFTASGGGRLSDTAAVSDESGVARTRWTLGPSVSASQGVQAQLPAAPAAAPAWFGALARAGAPAVLARVTGEALQGGVGATLADSVSVEVRDRHGNPVMGAEVEWEVTAGGGAATPARSVTGAAGTARTAWTLGPRADSAQGLQARLAGMDPVAFRADAATRGVTLVLAKRGGDGQSGAAGSLLADSLGVSLRLPDGRPVAGAT